MLFFFRSLSSIPTIYSPLKRLSLYVVVAYKFDDLLLRFATVPVEIEKGFVSYAENLFEKKIRENLENT